MGTADGRVERAIREAARDGTLVRISEAAPITRDSGSSVSSIKTLVIAEGQGASGFYESQAIDSIVPLLDGVTSYYDHPSRSEEADIPERRVRDKCGWFSDASRGSFADPSSNRKLAAAFATFHARDGDAVIASLLETTFAKAKRYPNAAPFVALSVNAYGVGAKGASPIDGAVTTIISKILRVDSVDIVTTAGRLGRFLAESSLPIAESRLAMSSSKHKLAYIRPI